MESDTIVYGPDRGYCIKGTGEVNKLKVDIIRLLNRYT